MPPEIHDLAKIIAGRHRVTWDAGDRTYDDHTCGFKDLHSVALAAMWERWRDAPETVHPHLYRVGKNAVVDYLRRVRGDARRRNARKDAIRFPVSLDDPDAHAALVARQPANQEAACDLARVLSLIAALPDAERLAMEGEAVDRDRKNTAAERGCSVQAVCMAVKRARQRLAPYHA